LVLVAESRAVAASDAADDDQAFVPLDRRSVGPPA
jgi:hypothetical protein